MSNWMLYGATGYTGRLIAEEAVRRGHSPILAGRSEAKLRPLAGRFNLPYRMIDLQDTQTLQAAVAEVDLVLHAAGPFTFTADPMIQACLAGRTHYLDITGEIPVFENTFAHDRAAQEQGICLISGVGFDVVPTDCMARYIAQKLPGATTLEMAIHAISKTSAGTTRSMLEMLPEGNRVRRDGKLLAVPFGQGGKTVRFSNGAGSRERYIMPIPWGDVATAYRTTGIPNITTYMAVNPSLNFMLPLAPLVQQVLKNNTVRKGLSQLIGRLFDGPDEQGRQTGRSYVWACVVDSAGQHVEAWLETIEAYAFTAVSSVLAVEKTLAQPLTGALTPALAFGEDFVLEIAGSVRRDRLG